MRCFVRRIACCRATRRLGDEVGILGQRLQAWLAVPASESGDAARSIDVLAAVHREGEVVSTSDGETEWTVRARLSDPSAGRLTEFITDGHAEVSA